MVNLPETSGSNAFGLWSRLFRSSQLVSTRVPSKRSIGTDAFVRTSLGYPSGPEAGLPAAETGSIFGQHLDSSLHRRKVFEDKRHAQNSAAASYTNFGYASADALSSRFILGGEIERGGNGVIRLLTDRVSGQKFACKTLPKSLYTAGADLHVSTSSASNNYL